MSRRGCESVSVQQLTVQVPPCLFCKRSKNPPNTSALCRVITAALGERGILGNGSQSQNQTDISRSTAFHCPYHISAIITLCYWVCLGFFYHSCRGRTDYFIHFGFLQWRRCLHRDYRITPFVSERARGEAVRND